MRQLGARIELKTSVIDLKPMLFAHHVAWSLMEGERAFGQATRSRRRASLTRRLFRRCAECAQLIVHDQHALTRRTVAATGVQEIPVIGDHRHGRARPRPRVRQRVPAFAANPQALAARLDRRAGPAPAYHRSR